MSDRTSTLGTYKIKLASWLPPQERYERQLIPVDPESEVEAGDVPGLNAQPEFRSWRMRSWWRGEGITWWERGQAKFRESSDVRPVSIGDGLELGARQTTAQAAAGGDFQDGTRFGYGIGQLWLFEDNTIYPWDVSDEHVDAGWATGASGVDITSIGDGDDATHIYTGHENGVIREVDSGSSAQHFAGGTFTYAPLLRTYEGQLFALDGDDLYLIDKSTTDTRTQKGDVTAGSSASYLGATPWCYGRMSVSDKGPIWLQRLDNGQTFIWEYNVGADAQAKIGKLATDFAFPYSLFFTAGLTVVAYRDAPEHSQPGDAHLWFRRGGQESYTKPIRSLTGSTASKPILIAGTVGDDLMFYFDGAIWAYNLSSGGVHQVATQTSTGTPEDAITFGSDMFISPVNGSNEVERFETKKYSLETATIDLGKLDFDYPGMAKILLDVTIVTDPLPADTSIQAAVSVDGGSFSSIGSASTTDNQTKHKWTVSTNAATVTGVEFELRLLPLTTDEDNTPTVREVTARATGADHVLKTVMVVDMSEDIGDQSVHTLISGLDGLAKAGDVVAFTDNFQQKADVAGTAYDVTVEECSTPEAMDSDKSKVSARVAVQAVALQND